MVITATIVTWLAIIDVSATITSGLRSSADTRSPDVDAPAAGAPARPYIRPSVSASATTAAARASRYGPVAAGSPEPPKIALLAPNSPGPAIAPAVPPHITML